MSEGLPEGWKFVPLSSLARIVSGGTPSRDVNSYWGGGIPWVTPTDITRTNGRYLFETQESITRFGLSSSSASLLPPSTILMTSRATVGESRIAKTEVCTNQGFKSLVPQKGVNGLFLYYQMQRLRGAYKVFGIGSTFLEVSKKDTERFSVPMPANEIEQQAIAAVIDSVDEAIEKTASLIAKYQQIKAGLMHDLFTRGVTADGKLRPPSEQAPELYQETPIGWIPKEWEFGPLATLLTGGPKNGYSPREVDEWRGCYALGLGCLTTNGFRPVQLKMVDGHAVKASGAFLSDGDLLVSRSNTSELVGLCGIYRDVGYPCIYPDLMMRIRPNASVGSEYLEQLLLNRATRKRLTALAVGTSGSMVKLNSKSLLSLLLAVPSGLVEQNKILTILAPSSQLISRLEIEKQKLQSQKAGLMHDLLTGKVTVKVHGQENTI